MNQLFYELIRVAIGSQDGLSRLPSEREWCKLYKMAEKQSLVGICFAGLQRLGADADEGFARIGISEMKYLNWMGQACLIQQRNEEVNRQCVELQAKLAADGMHSCILKGQGVGLLYGEYLHNLRQSGDIDIFVAGGMKRAYEYCCQQYGNFEWDYINAHIPVFEDTEVELHWRVHSHPNLFKNKQLQEWLKEHELRALQGNEADLGCGTITVPTTEFNAFFILLHCYHHMFESGLGLRQLMDYYFVLKEFQELSEVSKDSVCDLYKQFSMERFASAVMWIMKYVFGMQDKYLLCKPNEKEGRFILNEVMQNGNFGHHDERKHKIKNKIVAPFATRIQHNWHLATHYPSEFFWSPVWLMWHFVWKRTVSKRLRND